MRIRLLILAGLFFAAFGAAQSGIRVSGTVKRPLELTAADLAKMPRASVNANHHGTGTKYEGVWLHEILKKAGAAQGDQLRGKALTSYVIAKGQDGYEAIFSLAETDPAWVDNELLVADTADGHPIEGSFRLAVPRDKHGARSVRMLASIEVVQVKK